MILRKRLESIFENRITDAYPTQSVMKGHDVSDRDDQPGVTLYCSNNKEAEDFPARSGVFQADLMLYFESISTDEDNTQASIETTMGNVTEAVEDLTAVQALCATSYTDIHIHDIQPNEDAPEREGYSIDNTFGYLLVYEYLNV